MISITMGISVVNQPILTTKEEGVERHLIKSMNQNYKEEALIYRHCVIITRIQKHSNYHNYNI